MFRIVSLTLPPYASSQMMVSRYINSVPVGWHSKWWNTGTSFADNTVQSFSTKLAPLCSKSVKVDGKVDNSGQEHGLSTLSHNPNEIDERMGGTGRDSLDGVL